MRSPADEGLIDSAAPGLEPRPDRPVRVRRVSLAVALSLMGHLAILFVFFWIHAQPPAPSGTEPVAISLIDAPPQPAPPAPPAPSPPRRAKPAAHKAVAHSKAMPQPVPRNRPSPRAPAVQATDTASELSESQLAQATTAGTGSGAGSGGRACNMVAWLQGELRKDPEVQAALIEASHGGRTALVWNGDWIRSPGQDGEGLAIVREAVMIHVAFAPAACRADPVRGLVLLSLNDAPGSPRLALGAGEWRWTDLLHPR